VRILIIGGTRFIGPRVARKLTAGGHHVTVLHRGQTRTSLPAQVEIITAERSALPELKDLKTRTFDVVLDMICMTQRDARDLMASFRGAAARVVVLSSMDVYKSYGRFIGTEPTKGAEPAEAVPLSREQTDAESPVEQIAWQPAENQFAASGVTEDSALRTVLYPYRAKAKSEDDLFFNYEKILVEREVMSGSSLPGTVLRLPLVYGPGDHRCFDYLKRIQDGRTKILLGEAQAKWRWTRGYVENVADAIVLATTDERAAGQTYNIGEEDPLTEAGWSRAIGKAAGWNGRIVTVHDDLLPAHLRMPFDFTNHVVGDTRKIRKELGFAEQVSRETAIKQTVYWESLNLPVQFDSSRFNYLAEDELLNRCQG
jgi:nucleoside-diphosphate-sugar epimerase